jgi:hypothetical protein
VTRYFTPAEVDALIPELERLVGPLVDAHGQALEIRAALRAEQQRVQAAGGGLLDREAWRRRTDRLAALDREIRERIGAITELGGTPKDLAMGLVDFPCLLDGREVNLCWRLGEGRAGFWHGLDEGFAARKPLPGDPA